MEMDELILKNQSPALRENAALMARCNEHSAAYGLTLSPDAVASLQRGRFEALRSMGRVELGEGVLLKLVDVFRASPYLSQSCYEQTLSELQELFYYFKNECRDRVSDDELIDAMALIYNEVARGSTEYISGVDWETMCSVARTGSIAGTELERPAPGDGYDGEE